MKDIGFDVDKPKSGTKSKIPKKRMEQIEQYIDEMYDNMKTLKIISCYKT